MLSQLMDHVRVVRMRNPNGQQAADMQDKVESDLFYALMIFRSGTTPYLSISIFILVKSSGSLDWMAKVRPTLSRFSPAFSGLKPAG